MKYTSTLFLILFQLIFCIANVFSMSRYYSDSSRYDIKSYTLDLHLSNENTIIKGFATISAISKQEDLKVLFLELNPELLVTNITLNNAICAFSRSDKWLKVQFPVNVKRDSFFICTIFYSGEISKITSMGGFKSEYMNTYQQHITYTLSEPFGSYLWFPCKQELTDKADSVFINITTKEGIEVASNGLLMNMDVNPAKKEVRYQWESHYPTAYYLIAVALADYKEYNYYLKSVNTPDSFLFQNYYLSLQAEDSTTTARIRETNTIMNLYERLLVPFPFRKEKYGHCQAPIGGGMENQTLTMINSFTFGLIAHELAHSWLGDMVTCATWKDIWVNEGLTSYFEYLAYEYLKPDEASAWLSGAVIQAYTEPEGTIIIPSAEVEDERRIFNYTLTYRKGAYMVHQLRQKVNNDSLFFGMFRSYLNKYAYSNATVEDFKNEAESYSHLSLDPFFQTWFYGAGMPKIIVLWEQDKDKLKLQLSQHGTSAMTPAFDVTYELRVLFENGTDTILRINQVFEEENIEFTLEKKIKNIQKLEGEALIISTAEASLMKYYEVKIYPNPGFDTLNVDFANSERNRQIEILNLRGASFGRFAVNERKNTVNISQLPSGIYLIKVIGKKKASNLKFVKQ